MNDIETWFLACSSGDISRVKKYIDAGIDIDICDEYGNTGLILASSYRNTQSIKILLKAGANVNFQNRYAQTSLIRAVSSTIVPDGLIDIIEILLDHGADSEVKDAGGRTLIDYVCYKEDLVIINDLVKDINNRKANIKPAKR